MTPCTTLSDRMPDVALGRARWTADEERHLATCPDCRAEWAIVSTASRLGSVTLDAPEPMAARVLGRLRVDRTRARARRRWWMGVGAAAAAAVALATWTQRPTRPRTAAGTPPIPNQTVELAMPELDSLPEEALDSILRAIDDPLARSPADEAQADDQGDRELERMLAGLEG